MTTETLLKPNEIESNPIGLDPEQVENTVERLNQLVCSLFIQFHQYQKHHWMVEGPTFRDLHLYLEDSYNAVHESLDELAERMTVLGGVPTAAPHRLGEFSVVSHEREGMFDIRTMLNNDLLNERKLAGWLRSVIPSVTQNGDFATETLLKKALIGIEDRAHHLDHYLSACSLERGRGDPTADD